MFKRSALLDISVVVVMCLLLYYGASGQMATWYSDAGKYQCYSFAFWHGVTALKTLPVPEIQCRFITQPPAGSISISTASLVQMMQAHSFPTWLMAFVAAQSPTQPFHSLPHEYPFLTLIPFSTGLVTSPYAYQAAFAIAMLLCCSILYFMLKTWKSRNAAIAFAIYAVICCWATAATRYDIVPAVFALGAFLLAERSRWRWAFALLAISTMFKFYPIILVPAFLIAQQKVSYHFRRSWWKGLDAFVLVCAATTLVSLLFSVEGTLGPLGYFSNRPVQAESTAASILWLASFVGFPIHYNAAYSSLNMISPLSSGVSSIITILLIVGLIYVCWLQWRGKITLAVSLLLMLLVVICTGKVFSPQYLLWVIPFVAYIGECNRKWLISWVSIGALTTWIFPYIYDATRVFLRVPDVPTFHPVVFARNVLLVAFVIALLCYYARPRKTFSVPLVESTEIMEREPIASAVQVD